VLYLGASILFVPSKLERTTGERHSWAPTAFSPGRQRDRKYAFELTFKLFTHIFTGSRESAVDIETGHGTGRPTGRSSSPGRVKNFLLPTSSRPALRPAQPPIQWVPVTLSPGIKRPGREADYSPPTNAKVKKTSIYTSTPP
jgi:hypothetical protein